MLHSSILDILNNNANSNTMNNNHIVYIFINQNVPEIKLYNLNSNYERKNFFEFITKKNLIFEAE